MIRLLFPHLNEPSLRPALRRETFRPCKPMARVPVLERRRRVPGRAATHGRGRRRAAARGRRRHEGAHTNPGCLGGLDVQRVAQRQRDFSFRRGERDAFGIFGVTARVTTVDGCGCRPWPCSWSFRVPAVSTSTLLSTVRDIGFSSTFSRALHGDDDIHSRARDDEACHADHFVHLDRHGPHALGIDGGRPAPASIGASLLSVSGSFSTTEIRPRSTTFSIW